MHRACELKDQTYKKTRTLHFSESMLVSLGVPSRPSPGSDPGSEEVPSRFAMCFILQRFGPIQVRGGGHPGPILVPSVPSLWKATKEYLNNRGTKSEFFKCAFGPRSSHPFSLNFPLSFPLQALFTLPPLLPSSSLPLFPIC